MGFGRGCRYFFLNCSKERGRNRRKEGEKAYRDNNRDKYLHPLLYLHQKLLIEGAA
jgi:hypothetical protein